MNKAPRLSADQRDDLVAYLDGELPDPEMLQIDQVLARSEVARHEVEALARTWELLDLLHKSAATQGFAERTLTTIKVAEQQVTLAEQPWFRYIQKAGSIALTLAVLALFAAGGYFITTRLVPNPQAELLTALPLYRNLDLYLELNDLEFVNQLRRQALFNPAANSDAPEPGARRLATSEIDGPLSASVLTTRFDTAAKMSQVERDRVLKNELLFKSLPPERQAALRELHRQISKEPEAVHALLESYALWLQTLSPGQRDDLRKSDNSAARIELVRRYRTEQDASRETRIFDLNLDLKRGPKFNWPFPHLEGEEFAAVMNAGKAELELYEQRRIDSLSTPAEKYVLTIRQLLEGARSRKLKPDAAQRMIAAIPDEDVRRYILRSTSPEDQQRELMRQVGVGMSSFLREELKQFMPSEKDLQELFVSDKIDGDTRHKLMQLPPHELTPELVRRYFEQSDNPQLKRLESLRKEVAEILFREGIWRGGFSPRGDRNGPRPGGPGGFGNNDDSRRPFPGGPFGPRPGDRPGPPPEPPAGVPTNPAES